MGVSDGRVRPCSSNITSTLFCSYMHFDLNAVFPSRLRTTGFTLHSKTRLASTQLAPLTSIPLIASLPFLLSSLGPQT